MSHWETADKGAAICEACGAAFSVWILDDGSLTPIGNGDSCSCGSAAFALIDETALTTDSD